VIKTADWIMDLGPEGGDGGGTFVGEGPPEQVAFTAGSHTGRYLKKMLASGSGDKDAQCGGGEELKKVSCSA